MTDAPDEGSPLIIYTCFGGLDVLSTGLAFRVMAINLLHRQIIRIELSSQSLCNGDLSASYLLRRMVRGPYHAGIRGVAFNITLAKIHSLFSAWKSFVPH